MNIIEIIFKRPATCDHSYGRRAIYGDERLMLGRIEEFRCDKCGKIVAKLPPGFGPERER